MLEVNISMDVQLVIKAPNQNFDDQVILCNLDWTIKRLKTHLSEVYPNKPVVQEQKLIYSGRLLHDHLHLKDILRHEDSQSHAHILHLVCNGKNNLQSQTQTSTSSQNLLNQPTQQVSEELNTNSPHLNSSPVEENVLRHRNISPLSQSNNFSPVFQPNAMQATAYPPLPNDPQYLAQMAAMQQMYAYYMTQYMQSANPAFFGNSSTFPNVSNFQPQPVNTSYVPNEAVQRPANQRMNVQGGQMPEENEEMGNRDWLDHLSFCCRFLMLFSFMYFYSTPERLMIVVVCAIVVFLYHEGWFVRRPAVVVQQPDVQNGQMNRLERDDTNDNPENVNASPPNQNQSANGELQDGHELEAAMDGDEPPHVQNPDVANNNQIFSPLNFLAAFFSSLIPEPPPPVNIN